MKFFTITILCFLIIAACSTPEELIDEPVVVESEDHLPEWYNANRVSSSDSTHFSGYSMATAADSLEAINLGNESAIVNLRFEIDKFAEEVREELDSEQHNTPQFIINLRNTVQELPLTDSRFEREFEMRDDDVIQVYTRAVLSRSEVIDRLSGNLTDQVYIRALQTN
tara:strand:+ start:82867 stop:83370 length:504 start_codon:yes stop_codon:yes gene_type:complete